MLCAFASLALAASALMGQQTTPAAALPSAQEIAPLAEAVYEVASIHKYKPDGGPMMVTMKTESDGLNYTHVRIKNVISIAFGIHEFQISGGPDWIQSDLYDVHAKMDEQTMSMLKTLSPEQAKLARQHMAQALLADRFKLTVHHETKQFPIYKLVVAKGGSKLHESNPDDDDKDAIKAPESKPGMKSRMRMEFDSGAMLMTAQSYSMDDLAGQLSAQLGSNVENETGLKGEYDFTLRYAPDDMRAAAPNPAGGSVSLSDNSGTTIFAALQDQLGLKLESQKGPLDVVVIDHIEPPSEN